MKRAWFWMLDYLFAGWWQLRGVFARRVPASFGTGSGTPVLLIAGVYEPWFFLRALGEHLNAAGHPVHVATEIGYNRASVADAAAVVTRYLEEHALEGVTVVAHSKGGLIGKQLLATTDRVSSLVAIATPFGGSRYANYMLTRPLKEFRPVHETITGLGAHVGLNARVTSIYPTFDPHIPEGSRLEGATNVEVDTAGHFRVIAHPRVLAEVEIAVERKNPAPPGVR